MKHEFALRTSGMAALFSTALLMPHGAGAQCAFERSPKAKLVSSSMVRVTRGCPTVAMPVPDVVVGDGMPACSVPIYTSTYSFADGGRCAARVGLKRSPDPCPLGSCAELGISVKCSGLFDAAQAESTGEVWTLRTTLEMTMDDSANGDMTVIDFPLELELPPSDGGAVFFKMEASTVDIGIPFSFPACTSAEIGDDASETSTLGLTLVDPAGDSFASIGVAGAGGDPCGVDLGKTKPIKGSLVRSFADCPGVEFPATNSVTADSVPSCSPPLAVSSRKFAHNGACKLAIAPKSAPCPGNPAAECTPLSVDVKCSGLQSAAAAPLNEAGWYLRLVVRPTVTDGGVDATAFDSFVRIDLPAIVDGKARVKTLVEELPGPMGTSLEPPACSSMRLIQAMLFDPTDTRFAQLGVAAFPK